MPRTMRFIQWWKERCSAMLEASRFTRKKIEKEVEILDDEMSSRYEEIHGHEGLGYTLVEQFNAMAELRMMAEYRDYLVLALTSLRLLNYCTVRSLRAFDYEPWMHSALGF